MAETKVTKNEMGYTKTTDAAGWTIYDYGGFKQYRKKGSITESLTASQWKFSVNSVALPTGMSTLGSNFIESTIIASDAAVCVFATNVSSASALNFAMSNQYSGAINNFTVDYSFCITEA